MTQETVRACDGPKAEALEFENNPYAMCYQRPTGRRVYIMVGMRLARPQNYQTERVAKEGRPAVEEVVA